MQVLSINELWGMKNFPCRLPQLMNFVRDETFSCKTRIWSFLLVLQTGQLRSVPGYLKSTCTAIVSVIKSFVSFNEICRLFETCQQARLVPHYWKHISCNLPWPVLFWEKFQCLFKSHVSLIYSSVVCCCLLLILNSLAFIHHKTLFCLLMRPHD